MCSSRQNVLLYVADRSREPLLQFCYRLRLRRKRVLLLSRIPLCRSLPSCCCSQSRRTAVFTGVIAMPKRTTMKLPILNHHHCPDRCCKRLTRARSIGLFAKSRSRCAFDKLPVDARTAPTPGYLQGHRSASHKRQLRETSSGAPLHQRLRTFWSIDTAMQVCDCIAIAALIDSPKPAKDRRTNRRCCCSGDRLRRLRSRHANAHATQDATRCLVCLLDRAPKPRNLPACGCGADRFDIDQEDNSN